MEPRSQRRMPPYSRDTIASTRVLDDGEQAVISVRSSKRLKALHAR
jgi:hypothetical protein